MAASAAGANNDPEGEYSGSESPGPEMDDGYGPDGQRMVSSSEESEPDGETDQARKTRPPKRDRPHTSRSESGSVPKYLKEFLETNAVFHACAYKSSGCCFEHRSLEILQQHVATCPSKPKEEKKLDAFADLGLDKYQKHEVIRATREITNEKDDNFALLAEARFWSAPANWTHHQAGAVQSKMGPFTRWNYHFDRIGLTVRNKGVTLEMHDTKSKPIH